jgi:hypothetical protein
MRWAHAQADCERSAGWTQSAAQTNAIHAAVTAGRVDEILNAARAGVARLLASRNRRSLALARYPLLAALLVAGAIDEARAVACDGWSDVVAFGMQAWWVDQLALLDALESRPHSAARLVGYADLLYAAAGERRDALRSASVKRAMKLAADALGEAALQKLKADGATLRDGDVPAVAFGDAGR